MSGGSNDTVLQNSEKGRLFLAGKLAFMGRFVEEVVLELSSQLRVQEADEILGKP